MNDRFYLNHIYLFFGILSFCAVTVTFALSVIVFKKGYGIFRFYIPSLFFSMTRLLCGMMIYYALYNFPRTEHGVIFTLTVLVGAIYIFEKIFLTMFLHDLVLKNTRRIANAALFVFAAAYLAAYFLRPLEFNPAEMKFSLSVAIQILFLGVNIIWIIYMISLVMIRYKKLGDPIIRRMITAFIVIYAVFTITLIYKALNFSSFRPEVHISEETISKSLTLPGAFLAWSIIMSYYLARYFIPKKVADYDDSFERFVREYEITGREMEISRHLMNGLSNEDISDELSISVNTVKSHLVNIFKKTGARSRTELMSIIIQNK
ncbi:MAG: helix-turn-helix transcriptional regulator [Spirochaetes bacterium]|jgi:DNA-binding CsgD family transcriptional regulator|nr:helix-turn-helix transcriptional regulator [Spirochaetota bacterium]